MSEKEQITRRGFLKLSGAGLLGTALSKPLPRNFECPEVTPEIGDFIVLNERVAEILSFVEPLGFDQEGNLLRLGDLKEDEDTLVTIIPTEHNKQETEKVESVELLIVHFDGQQRFWDSGIERHALSTVWALNANKSSHDGLGLTIQWCIDNFPITKNEERKGGYGILQSQLGSGDAQRPYTGAHVKIVDYDDRRLKTLEHFKNLGIKSRLEGLVEKEITKFNLHTVGFEQTGTEFAEGFPGKNQPGRRQIANNVSLAIAVMKQFNLNPWDVLGHREVQFKSDPGEYFMATLRFLLGVAALKGKVSENLVFANQTGSTREAEYFEKVAEYLKRVDRYGRLWHWKDYVGYDELIDSLNNWYLIKDRLKFLR